MEFKVFSDYDVGRLCVDSCIEKDSICKENCSDDYCEFECGQQLPICVDSCPCYSNCPGGCESCESDFCPCGNLDTNLDYQQCSTALSNQFKQCIEQCNSPSCNSQCNLEYARE